MCQAALPHAHAVSKIIEEPGSGVAGRRHRRPPLPPVEDRRHDQGGRQRQPQPGNRGSGGQRHRPPGAGDRAAQQPAGREGPAAGEQAGQRPGVVGERAEAPGEQRRRGPGDGGAGHRPPRRRRGPGQRAPSRHRAGGHGARMAQFQRCRGRAVVAPPAQPVGKAHPVLVADRRPGLVPDVPAGGRQPPDEVDILPERHVLHETAGRGRAAHHQRRTRHIRHPRTRPHDALGRPHVECRPDLLVPRQPPAAPLKGHDPGRHGPDRWVGEVRQQRREPARPRDAVGIDEGDQRRAYRGEPGVPGGARSPARAAAQAQRACRRRGRRHGRVIRRPVVHHDDPHPVQAGQAAGKLGRAVAHRDDRRDLARPRAASRIRVREPGVEQPPRQCLRGGPGHRRAVPPPAGQRRAPRAQAQQAQRRSTDQDAPASEGEQPRVRAQAHPGGHG